MAVGSSLVKQRSSNSLNSASGGKPTLPGVFKGVLYCSGNRSEAKN